MIGAAVARAVPALWVLVLAAGVGVAGRASADQGAAGLGDRTTGWDTYRRLDRLPYLSADTQTLQVSSFDRSGGDYDISTGNHNGNGGCLSSGGAGCVIAEDHGAGEIDSIWLTRDGGNLAALGDIRIELDGRAVVDTGLQALVDGELGAPFVWPLVANAAQSPGGDYVKVPMPYRHSMRISVTSHLEYYHVDYRQFPSPAGVGTFAPSDPALDVLAALRAAGTGDPKPASSSTMHTERTVDVPAGQEVTLAEPAGPGSISALRLRLPDPADRSMSDVRLRIDFDGRPSVDSPLGEFFGAGLGANPVRSLMFATTPQADGVQLSCWWPMPFARGARVSLVNTGTEPAAGVAAEVATTPDPHWADALAGGRAGYFTARSHAGPTIVGQDWVFADERGHGKFVGVSHTIRGSRTKTAFSDDAPYFLEGAERVYTDGAASPQWYGTGTEDLYEGGWYFKNGKHFSDPLTGQPDQRTATGGCADYCVAVYRLMLAEAIGYHDALRFGIEHGKRNMVHPDYSSTAFLYAQAGDTLVDGDEVNPADPLSRLQHGYTDTDADDYLLVGEYEGVEDTRPVAGLVRGTAAPISFSVVADPANRGLMLRRTSDQAAGYQSADVDVDGTVVGNWLQPRGNPIHRWLDDTYLLPPAATAGKSQITITLTPVAGAPPWTASRYRVEALTG